MEKLKLKVEKEKELLACMIAKPETLNVILSNIPIEMISEKHRHLFGDLKRLDDIDEVSITWELKKHNYVEMAEVLNYSCTILPNVEHRIKEFYEITDSITVEEILKKSYVNSKNSLLGLQTLTDTLDQLQKVKEKYERFEKVNTFNEQYDNIITRLENKSKNDDSLKITSLPSFNNATGGLNLGNMVGIAGAFKNGKTTFALNLVIDLAGQNIPVQIFSLEMSEEEIQDKILSLKTGIDNEKIRMPRKLLKEDIQKILQLKTHTKKSDEKIFIHTDNYTLTEIEERIKSFSQKAGVKVVLIDYLGLITNSRQSRNLQRWEEVTHISKSLKILAKETRTVIIILSQLNRSGIKEASSSNLADSLSIARDCDFLFTISKPVGEKQDGSYFSIKLDSSRHTPSGKEFLLQMRSNGSMKEIETKYDNSYSMNPPLRLVEMEGFDKNNTIQ